MWQNVLVKSVQNCVWIAVYCTVVGIRGCLHAGGGWVSCSGRVSFGCLLHVPVYVHFLYSCIHYVDVSILYMQVVDAVTRNAG